MKAAYAMYLMHGGLESETPTAAELLAEQLDGILLISTILQ
jgi:hypothetical protein